MDDRCPLGLKSLPTSVCPLAAERLRAIRNNQAEAKNITAGCDWYIQDRSANYCFFKYMADNEGEGHDTINIASLLHITQATVYADLDSAIQKTKEAGIGEIILGED